MIYSLYVTHILLFRLRLTHNATELNNNTGNKKKKSACRMTHRYLQADDD